MKINSAKAGKVFGTLIKVLQYIIIVVLAAALVAVAVLSCYSNYTQGDREMVGLSGNMAYATEYSQLKNYPSSDGKGRLWRDGMIGGNGKYGFINAGSPYDDTLIYQNVDLIMPTSRQRNELKDLTSDVQVARQAIINLDDSYVSADCVDWNYNYAFHPGHQLRLTQSKNLLYTDYVRYTNYDTGEVGVKYKDKNGEWCRNTFTSREDDVTVTELNQSSKGSKINLTLSVDDLSGMFKYGQGDETKIQYKKIVDKNCDYLGMVAHYPDYDGSSLKNGGYAGISYIVTVGGTKELTTLNGKDEDINVGDTEDPAIKISNADAVYIVSKVDRTFDMGAYSDFAKSTQWDLVDNVVAQCKDFVAKYSSDNSFDYNSALKQSAAEQKNMFDAMSFSLGDKNDKAKLLSNNDLLDYQRGNKKLTDAMVEAVYNQARFAMICSSGYTMSRLSGMWTGEWMPGWRSMYTMDANVNLQSSGMNTSNIKDFSTGYINFILRQQKDWQINAEKCYGMKDAIMCPVNTDGDGALNAEYCLDYPFNFWNAGASWMIQPIYEYYQCYGDGVIKTDDGEKQLLSDILLPLLTKQSNFWQQLVSPEYYTDKDGNARYKKGKTALNGDERYLIIPSYSPENKTGGGKYQSTLAANSTMDISAAKMGLQMTIDVENDLKQSGYKDRVAKWQALLDKMPKYMTDETGALKEWCANQYEENNKHRHISHLYVAWPNFETQGDEGLKEQAYKAMENRTVENSASHGFVHKALVYARLNKSDDLYNTLHTLLDSKICYTSLMTDHNTDRGSNTYCTDTEFGIVGIVNEALLYSNTGKIDVLPSCPSQWTEGEINNIKSRTGATVSFKWQDGKVTEIVVTSDKEQTIDISVKGVHINNEHFKAGETKTIKLDK